MAFIAKHCKILHGYISKEQIIVIVAMLLVHYFWGNTATIAFGGGITVGVLLCLLHDATNKMR